MLTHLWYLFKQCRSPITAPSYVLTGECKISLLSCILWSDFRVLGQSSWALDYCWPNVVIWKREVPRSNPVVVNTHIVWVAKEIYEGAFDVLIFGPTFHHRAVIDAVDYDFFDSLRQKNKGLTKNVILAPESSKKKKVQKWCENGFTAFILWVMSFKNT